MDKIIDGKKIADNIKEDLRKKIYLQKKEIGLAFLLIGEDPASMSYIKMKKKACLDVGIKSHCIFFKNSTSEKEVIQKIESLNTNPRVHGILVQMPLPPHINEENIFLSLNPKKDVDGFHPINMGKLLLGYKEGFVPCTPLGIGALLEKSKVPLEGKNIVIMGRSNIVGKPLALFLLQKNATITITHSKTKNIHQITNKADILISAIGKPLYVKKDMIKKDAVIIDVGINRIGKKIVGDVDFKNVLDKVSKITPVPFGVGPMTIAMLLKNTYKGFLQNL